MARRAFTIFLDEKSAKVCAETRGSQETVEVSLPEAPGPETFADAVTSSLSSLGWKPGRAVAIALPSRRCLAATLERTRLPQRGGREALLYLLEEKMPAALEELAADFLPSSGESILGVAVVAAKLRDVVDALELRGAAIECITPMAILAAASFLEECRALGEDLPDLILLGGGGAVEIFALARGEVTAWRHVPARCDDLALHLESLRSRCEGRARIGASGIEPDLFTALLPTLANLGITAERNAADPMESLAARASWRILRGKTRAPLNLRRGPLESRDVLRGLRTNVRVALLASVLLLASLGIAFAVRAARWRALAEADRRAIAQVFAEVLALEPLPTSVPRRLETRLKELEAAQGPQGSIEAKNLAPSVLPVLEELLRRLPEGLRYVLLDVAMGDGPLEILAHVRTHGDADEITTRLRQGGLFEIEAPRTEKLRGEGVECRIRASVRKTREGGSGAEPPVAHARGAP